MPDQEVERKDQEELALAASGDREAFTRLVLRHQGAVYRFARAMVTGEDQAQDVLQETFLEAWRAASSFQGEGSARSWLLGIARHRVARRGRLRSGQPTHFEPLEALGLEAGWGSPSPESRAIVREHQALLHEALATLSVQDREILTLRDMEGLSGPEVAQLLGLELAAAKTRLHRARLRLMAALRRGGYHGA